MFLRFIELSRDDAGRAVAAIVVGVVDPGDEECFSHRRRTAVSDRGYSAQDVATRRCRATAEVVL